MAQMKRNVNLEEIDSDALFGISALKNQTVFQKIIFFGSVALGVALNVFLPMYFGTPGIVCILLFLGLLLAGVAFGCNYTQDMTYGKYLYYFFFHPKETLYFVSTEDAEQVRRNARAIKSEEEMLLRRQKQADPNAQKKLLAGVLGFAVLLVLLVTVIFVYGGIRDREKIHHTAEIQAMEE